MAVHQLVKSSCSNLSFLTVFGICTVTVLCFKHTAQSIAHHSGIHFSVYTGWVMSFAVYIWSQPHYHRLLAQLWKNTHSLLLPTSVCETSINLSLATPPYGHPHPKQINIPCWWSVLQSSVLEQPHLLPPSDPTTWSRQAVAILAAWLSRTADAELSSPDPAFLSTHGWSSVGTQPGWDNQGIRLETGTERVRESRAGFSPGAWTPGGNTWEVLAVREQKGAKVQGEVSWMRLGEVTQSLMFLKPTCIMDPGFWETPPRPPNELPLWLKLKVAWTKIFLTGISKCWKPT